MKEDCKALEEQGLTNVCPVRVLDEETNTLVDSHILFNQWVDKGPETFKLVKVSDNDYKLYRHGKLIKRHLKLENVDAYTSNLKQVIQVGPNGAHIYDEFEFLEDEDNPFDE